MVVGKMDSRLRGNDEDLHGNEKDPEEIPRIGKAMAPNSQTVKRTCASRQ